MKNTAISVNNLSKIFTFPVKNEQSSFLKNLFFPEKRTVTAVDGISFEVAEGERLAFIGPNGAGKSTTIKMLTGILFPSGGDVNVLGLDPRADRKAMAYKIATVFGQRSQLFPNLPLTDSLEFFGVMYDLSHQTIKKRKAELISVFDLSDFANQPVRKLSLGQRMRAEIAVALIHKPKIIFLDEPTIGLDIVAKNSLRDLLLKINEVDRTTIFLTSHDVGDIEAICSRTIVVNHGQIITDLPTKDLAKSYAYEKLIDLIPAQAFTNFPELHTGLSYKLQTPQKITISVDNNQISIKRAVQDLMDIFEVSDLEIYSAELETVIRNIYEAAAP